MEYIAVSAPWTSICLGTKKKKQNKKTGRQKMRGVRTLSK